MRFADRGWILAAVLLLAAPAIAHANLVWPAVYLQERLFTWWSVAVGLVIEYPFIRWQFVIGPRRALVADVTANGVSAIAGIVLVPASGMAWEMLPGAAYEWMFGWQPFGVASVVGAFFMACVCNAAIECMVYREIFRLDFRFRSGKYWWFVLANAGSVGVALASLWIVPLHTFSGRGPV